LEATVSDSISKLLLKFRAQDSEFGVTRETVKALARHFSFTETQVIHLALSRLAKVELPGYEPDDGPLSARELKDLRKIAQADLAKGKIVSEQSLF
jgi:hypothetical protein